jgi:hypothetical protein
MDVLREVLELPRLGWIVGDVSLGVADGADLKGGVEADLGTVADDQLGGAAPDVADQGARAGLALGDRPEIGEVRLVTTVKDPDVEGKPLAQLGPEYLGVLRIADRTRGDRADPM